MCNDDRKSGILHGGTLKTYAADTGSLSKYNSFTEQQQILDSRFKIPNNFTPARVGNCFMDPQNFPLVSGGEPNQSDFGSHFIAKRDFPFAKEQSNLPSIKRKVPEMNRLFVSNKCSELSNPARGDQSANLTKFSKEPPGDVYLEEASGSKMSNSRFRIETEKED